MKNIPKVSVVTICYNQEKYIEAALRSFVEQQTDFDFEIIIADDCSTDRTPEIVVSYAKKYPHLFNTILRKKNVGVQKNIKDALQQARGKYIALCEGDDYWTDPTKLQRQADFLDSHADYALCFHPVTVFFQNKEEEDSIYPMPRKNHHFTVGELLRWNFIQTNSVMYRKQNYDNIPENLLPLDWYLHLYHAQFGKVGFINRVMGAYRRHAGGIWWASHEDVDQIWRKYSVPYFTTYKEILKIYGGNAEYREIVYNSMNDLFKNIIAVDEKYGDTVLQKMFEHFPSDTETFILRQILDEREAQRKMTLSLTNTEESLRLKEHEVAELLQQLQQKDDLIQEQAEEINTIKTSKTWRARNKVARIVKKKVL